jgi:hypothetical protein
MLGAAGLNMKPPAIQTRQVGLRFTELDYLRLKKAAQARNMATSTLAQQLIIEWLEWLDSRGVGE